MKIEIIENKIDEKLQDVLWYGGLMFSYESNNHRYELHALGDIKCVLLDENKDVIVDLKFKNHQGQFYTVMIDYIKSDNELLRLLEKDLLTFDNNNWFEIFVYDKKDDTWESFVLDEGYYDGAYEMFEKYIKETELGNELS